MRRAIMTVFLVTALAACANAAEGLFRPWEPVGPGGGGGNFRAAISPHDTRLYFAACDMGGFYRSEDAGANWAMIDGIEHTTMPVVFDPKDPNTCYVAHNIGFFLTNGWALSKTEDKGRSWKRLYGFTGAYSRNAVTCLAINPLNTSEMFAGTRGPKPGRILKSDTGGRFWQASDEGIPADAAVLGIYYLPPVEAGRGTAPVTMCAITDAGPFASDDGGATWRPSS
ncbi:MAG: WD40/YVTN/BNR-like repeat-containing protein, partial [Planctomycetota bacterium]